MIASFAYVPADYPLTFVWLNVATRFVQGYGDSLTWTTCFSVINIIFKEDKAQKIGMAEAAQGIGDMCGPMVGAFLFSMVGYKFTFITYAIVFTAISGFCMYVLPDKLN